MSSAFVVVISGSVTVKIARGWFVACQLEHKIKKTLFHLGRFCSRILFWVAVVTSVLLVILVLALKFVVLPNVESYQGDIVSRVAAASGMDVAATAIRGGWSGFRPYIELENVVFRETAGSIATGHVTGAEALKIPRMTASLSWWSLLIGQIRFADVSLVGPELALSRRKDGLLYFAGRALNAPREAQDDGRLVEWLLGQSGVEVRHATLTWNDELTPGTMLQFADVGVRIEKGLGGHQFGLVATPPVALARQIEVRGKLQLQKSEGRWIAAGHVYAAATNANFAELKAHAPVPDALQSGLGNVRAWFDIDNTAPLPAASSATNATVAYNTVRAITADVNLLNTKAQLSPDVATLNIARLAGRIEYMAQEGGFTVGSKALEFRTREGVTLPPADFSLTLQHQSDPAAAKGELAGSGIDLKVVAALLEYFPVPKDFRAFVARFGPRGLVTKSSFAWTGYPDDLKTYRIRGVMTNFAINADGNTPGISGFTGTVEGDQAGGKFTVVSKNLQLDLPNMMRAPLVFETLESEGGWNKTVESVDVNFGRVAFANADVAGEFSGHYSRFRADGPRAKEEKGPGSLDITGKLTRAKATAISKYLPNGAAITRDYLDWAVRDGEILSAAFSLKGEIFEFPFHKGKGGNFRIAAKVKDIDFRYAAGWPTAENVTGDLVFENTGFSAKVDTGQFFNARVKATTIAIDDFAMRPYMLSIQGVADARGEDVTRFLRESPLIETVGAFTKSVVIEGPGALDLSLKIPVGPADVPKPPLKITGSYVLKRGQAKPVVGPLVTALAGTIAFTESSVKSSEVTGMAYGNPLAVTIASSDTGVTTEFAGRVDVSQLGDVLPFTMPQQVTGTTDFSGRIASRDGGAEISIDSNLLGVTSKLPAPLAKRADEPRKLHLVFANVGQASEKIGLTLAGNMTGDIAAAGAASSTTTQTDTPQSRIDARFQRRLDANSKALVFMGGIASVGVPVGNAPVPEGLWFAGTMPLLDFDSWKQAFDSFYPPVAASGTAPPTRAGSRGGIEMAGFDFKLGGLIAYGRPFDAMTLKGRHGGEDWRLTVDSQDAVGDISWRAGAFNDQGAVRARLQKLVLADEVPQPQALVDAARAADIGRETDMPALDIIADAFTLKDRELGKLELRARPQGADWKIDQLNITTGHAKLEMAGLWERNGGHSDKGPNSDNKSRTTMNLKLATTNLNALFNQFGYGDYMKGGKAQLEGQLSWPGHSYAFNLATLSGNFKLTASDGRFAKIEPGAGKLLGLMSLQSLPRRITLDFRDIFSEGLAFDKIEGSVKVTNGTMAIDNFEITGPAANIKSTGEVILPTEQVNLKMKVSPLIGGGVALGIGVVLTPVAGVAAYGLSKLLQGTLSYEMVVTGKWDDPQVEEIRKNVPAVPATAPANPPAEAPRKAS